jgi:hypothetical protein
MEVQVQVQVQEHYRTTAASAELEWRSSRGRVEVQ